MPNSSRRIKKARYCDLLDLNDSKSIYECYEQAISISPTKCIDALFNNAGFGLFGATEDLTRSALREQFETNVFGTQELTNLVVRRMRDCKINGKIIYNSSVLGFVPMAYRGAYSASKAALESLADTLRIELDDSKIQVSIIQPGPIESHFNQNAFKYHLEHFVKKEGSYHTTQHSNLRHRLTVNKQNRYRLEPSAVTKCVVHAIESSKPKRRYRVTQPTKVFSVLMRVLPRFIIDKLLIRAGKNGEN